MKIETFARRNWWGKLLHYFRVRADNGYILVQSEGYSRRIDMIGTIHNLRNGLTSAEIKDAD